MKPILEYAVTVRSPYVQRDMAKIEQVATEACSKICHNGIKAMMYKTVHNQTTPSPTTYITRGHRTQDYATFTLHSFFP